MDFKIYATVPGKYYIVDVANLRYKTILKVKREGRGYDINNVGFLVSFVPPDGSRIVNYVPAFGELVFPKDEPFVSGETVYVLYQ